MLLLDINHKIINLNNGELDFPVDYFWVLNLFQRDLMVQKLNVFEEITGDAYLLEINKEKILVPSYWNILIFSEETYQLDIIDMTSFGSNNFNPLVYDYSKYRMNTLQYKVLDLIKNIKIQSVSLNKNCMLCYPIGDNKSIFLSPNDNYIKYIKDCTVGDLY